MLSTNHYNMALNMRCNLKNLTLVCVAFVVLWLIICLLDMLHTARYSRNVKDHTIFELESRVDSLQNRLTVELEESQKLLERIKDLLEKKISGPTGHRVKADNAGDGGPVLPVLVISCDRVTVSRCLDNLIKYRPSKETFPIIVSQDCGHNATYNVIKRYTNAEPTITVVRQPDLSDIPLPKPKAKFKGYYKIARHFKFALHHVLVTLGHEAVIIVEDDLDISPDFFEYFQGTYPLLLKDPSLWCISAWNDNGKKELIDASQPSLLHRTDFFPGLGWLLRRESWLTLEPKWPEAFFDDWLRDQKNTDERSCIRPEVSRTYSFGKVGVSKGLFFDMHLRNIQLNINPVEFTKLDLSYLLKENYDADLDSTVYSLPAMSSDEVMAQTVAESDGAAVRVPYSDAKSYRRAAKKLGLMDDFRSGIPRTAYRGIVTCFTHGRRVYLAPDFEWTKYDPSWS